MDRASEWYRTLDLQPGAGPREIRRAWRDLAQVWHPDRFSDNPRLQLKAEEMLKQINEAYAQLRRLPASGQAASTSRPRYEPETHDRRSPEITHLQALEEGARVWNLWRSKYSNITPNLAEARLEGMTLSEINFSECILERARLDRADLYKANLTRAKAAGANLKEAILHRAIAIEADLSEANLRKADLASVDLRGADLRWADLTGANVTGVRLEGADLRNAVGLDPLSLRVMAVDSQTKLP